MVARTKDLTRKEKKAENRQAYQKALENLKSLEEKRYKHLFGKGSPDNETKKRIKALKKSQEQLQEKYARKIAHRKDPYLFEDVKVKAKEKSYAGKSAKPSLEKPEKNYRGEDCDVSNALSKCV